MEANRCSGHRAGRAFTLGRFGPDPDQIRCKAGPRPVQTRSPPGLHRVCTGFGPNRAGLTQGPSLVASGPMLCRARLDSAGSGRTSSRAQLSRNEFSRMISPVTRNRQQRIGFTYSQPYFSRAMGALRKQSTE